MTRIINSCGEADMNVSAEILRRYLMNLALRGLE
jgi:hypothetical protein